MKKLNLLLFYILFNKYLLSYNIDTGLNYIDKLLLKPQVKALLDTIAEAEGTYSKGALGYRLIFGGTIFSSFLDHPKKFVKVKNNPISSASGRYQILYKTWTYLKNKYHLKDFSPKNQDRAAILLIKESYGLRDLLLGRFNNLCKKIGKVWSPIPYNNYGQPKKSISYLNYFYNKRLKYYVNNS